MRDDEESVAEDRLRCHGGGGSSREAGDAHTKDCEPKVDTQLSTEREREFRKGYCIQGIIYQEGAAARSRKCEDGTSGMV